MFLLVFNQYQPQICEELHHFLAVHSQPPLSNYALERDTLKESINRQETFKEHNNGPAINNMAYQTLAYILLLSAPRKPVNAVFYLNLPEEKADTHREKVIHLMVSMYVVSGKTRQGFHLP